MLGHAMDFYIPDVPLEQIRYAGLRLQRGGVGFYPTSGSPFVHLDTGSIRHWPRMNHDQLAKVFPDGRTVHVPTDGKPLKGYELALADIEKRGNGDDAATVGKKPGIFAALFKGGKSSEDDEEAAAPVVSTKPAPVVAAAAPAPKAKVAATLQLASADAQIVPAPKAKAEAKTESKPESKPAVLASNEPKPETPADIINARGFWGDVPETKQASPAQVAALKARQAVGAADPQPTASVTEAFNKALAYAPAATSPVDRANIVAASAPIPRSVRPTRNPAVAATEINTVVAKGRSGSGQRDFDLDPSRRRQGQRHLDAGRDAGAEREQRDVDDGARRYRHDHDARLLRQAAGRDRHDLLGRSDDGHDHRPLHRFGHRQADDAVVQPAHRVAALRRGATASTNSAWSRESGDLRTRRSS